MTANRIGMIAIAEDLKLKKEQRTGAKGKVDDHENGWEVGIQTGARYDSSN